jgi:hypothetical protein
MCIITDEIKEVTNTEILVAINKLQKEQLTVYSNKTVNYTSNNFMILPVPNDVSEQIRFIDLTGIDVFSKLEQLFEGGSKSKSFSYGLSANSKDVEYHSVGSYDVFVCKSLQAIVNNFSVSPKVIELLAKYYFTGFSFLLCKLKSGKEFKYHPLAYVHKIKDQSLFIPTKHLHIHRQGEDYEKNYEYWDHHIYVYNYLSNLGFKNQVLVGFKDEVNRIMQEYKNESYFKLLGDVETPKLKFEDRVKIVSTVGLPKIPFFHDTVDSINRFVIKNVFLNDDLICSVY